MVEAHRFFLEADDGARKPDDDGTIPPGTEELRVAALVDAPAAPPDRGHRLDWA